MSGTDRSRLRWRCRRGMLELDLLLEGFLERGYPLLGPGERRLFEEKVLRLADQELHDLLLGHRRSEDPDVQRIIESIRAAQA